MVNNWMKKIQNLYYPHCCALCGSACGTNLDLCHGCRSDLINLNHTCRQCGLPLQGGEHMLCGQCLKHPPHFDRVICGYQYRPPLTSLIHGLKFSGRLQHARILTDLITTSVSGNQSTLPDCLIPVPLYRKRTRQRGFNQALELARLLSRQLAIPLDYQCCIRQQATEAQRGLDAKARRRNLRNAFAMVKPLPAKHLAIIDDVMTTGTTVNELARVLKGAGAESVQVWPVARAI